jgi:hypothetical protein
VFKRLCAIALLLAMPACSDSNNPTTTSPTASVSALSITGANPISSAGQTLQLSATALFADGTTQNVTASTTWSSSNPSVLVVSTSGLVTAITPGAATGSVIITASYRGVTANATPAFSGSGSSSTSTRGTMTALIDGVPWSGTVLSTANIVGDVFFHFGGDDGTTVINIAVTNGSTPTGGTYGLAPGTPSNAGLSVIQGAGAGQSWSCGASSSAGSGSVVISSLTPTGASGTFNFMLTPTPGTASTGTHSVTDGVFDLRF